MSTEYIEHHGILGMKWGVRRYQPYPKGKHGTFLGQSRDEDIRIKKGSEAYRVQSTKKFEGSGQTYISLDKVGNLTYLSASTASQGVAVDCYGNDNDGRAYNVTMKLQNDLIMPSYQKTMDTFVESISEAGGAKRVAKDLFTKSEKDRAKDFVKGIKNMSVDDLRDKSYVAFTSKFMKNSTAKDIFFKSLQDQGYNAIVDDWDRQLQPDEKSYTKAPVIVFKKDESLRQTKSYAVTSEDYNYLSAILWSGKEDADYRFPESAKKWNSYTKGG